jgi:hypothetical protein
VGLLPKKIAGQNQMLSALLLRELQPTRYREVVLTSFPSVAFLNNTLMEHYPFPSLLDSPPENRQ